MGITRRGFLKASLSFAGAASLGFAGWGMPEFAGPNIVLILTDDQPFHSAGLKPDGQTYWMPKLNAHMRLQGMEFTRAYVTTPVCSPSRVSMMTGRVVRNHAVYANDRGAERFKKLGLGRDHLAYHLEQEAGYHTGHVGKWHNHLQNIPGWTAPGYDEWVAVPGNKNPVMANVNGRVKQPRSRAGQRIRINRETE